MLLETARLARRVHDDAREEAQEEAGLGFCNRVSYQSGVVARGIASWSFLFVR